MNEKDFAEKILHKIEDEHIEPKPRWSFFVMHYVLWGIGVITLLLASIAVALIVFLVANNEWDVYPFLGMSALSFVLATIPHIWIILALLLLGATIYNIRHTRRGYRYHTVPFVIIVLGVPIILGGVWFATGIGDDIDHALATRVPAYQHMPGVRHAKWGAPERGLLAGEVIMITGKNDFVMKDFRGGKWHIMVSEYGEDHSDALEEHRRIRLIGKKTGEREFTACLVHPWILRGRAQRRGGDYSAPQVTDAERLRVADCLAR